MPLYALPDRAKFETPTYLQAALQVVVAGNVSMRQGKDAA